MARTKFFACRLSDDYKEALRMIANREHRTLTNTIEHLIRKYCLENGLDAPKMYED